VEEVGELVRVHQKMAEKVEPVFVLLRGWSEIMRQFAEIIGGRVIRISECEDTHNLEAALPIQFIVLDQGQEVNIGDLFSKGIFTTPPQLPQPTVSVQELWQAASDYECSFIQGSVIGDLMLGVALQKQKCLAVYAWKSSIWSLYYQRKAEIEGGGNPSTDFAGCGDIPFTVQEIVDEVKPA
jgi:hypothetical protein